MFSSYFLQFFTNEQAVISYGSEALRIVSFGFLAYGIGMVIIQAFNGAGDTNTPTWINFFAFWLLEIPLAYSLAQIMGFHEYGVYFAILSAETVLTLIAIILFRRGKWKLKKV